ncbi:hypothetical protein Tco_1379212 [Tanacetum coccineum]
MSSPCFRSTYKTNVRDKKQETTSVESAQTVLFLRGNRPLWLKEPAYVSKEGLGGGGLVVVGGRSSRESKKALVGAGDGEVIIGGVDLGVVKSLLGEIPKDVMGESGGETLEVDGDISNVVLGGDLLNRDVSFLDIVTKKVMSDFYMFGMRMKNGVFTKVDAFPAETYSVSMVEMAKAVCFLENHDARQHPMNVHTSLVLLQST